MTKEIDYRSDTGTGEIVVHIEVPDTVHDGFLDGAVAGLTRALRGHIHDRVHGPDLTPTEPGDEPK